MEDSQRTPSHLISQLLVTLFSFGLFMYFGFHLMHGEMGYFALRGVDQKIIENKERYKQLHAERLVIENRVQRLRPGSLDLDMLDERARNVLGFVASDDRVIIEK